jgi:hypothetical protein
MIRRQGHRFGIEVVKSEHTQRETDKEPVAGPANNLHDGR